MAGPDLSVFDRIKTKQDFDRLNDEFMLKRKQALGTSPAAIQVANEIQRARATGDVQRLNDLQSASKILKFDPGVYLGQDGQSAEIPGYSGVVSGIEGAKAGAKELGQKNVDLVYNPQIAAGEANAKNASELGYAAPIEAAKKTGSGDITQIQNQKTGRAQVSSTVQDVKDYYGQLKDKGAAVDITQSGMQNAENRIRSSAVGQGLGQLFGTEEQSIRNKINQQIPALINGIRQATGMSAKAMDSNVELQFYLQQATNPKNDIQANFEALDALEKRYGLTAQNLTSGAPESPVPVSPPKLNPAKIPMQAVKELRAEPSAQSMQEFDAVFGAGASKLVLGNGQ